MAIIFLLQTRRFREYVPRIGRGIGHSVWKVKGILEAWLPRVLTFLAIQLKLADSMTGGDHHHCPPPGGGQDGVSYVFESAVSERA